jgi:RNA polymerase sigma factor (sigma-70 family)
MAANPPRISTPGALEQAWGMLVRYFRRQHVSHADAEDYAQQLLLTLIERPQFQQAQNPKAYLYQCARHFLYRQWRARRTAHERLWHIGQAETLAAQINSQLQDEPADLLHGENIVDRALKSLDEELRRVVELRVAGYEVDEIAEELNLSRHQVKRRLVKARAALDPLVHSS